MTLFTIIILLLLFAAVIFYPRRGLIALARKQKITAEKKSIEDTLKHLYNYEYLKKESGKISIADSLNITGEAAAEIISKLESMGLLNVSGDKISLTAGGRSYALRVIRIHRLWEKYLADETGLHETDWHQKAEYKEHEITAEEAEELAAQLGNPLFDPHGDPIPTAEGELPVSKGKSILMLTEGETAVITHVEDEPPAVYAQIVAEGLYPGMHIKMISADDKRVNFEANGEECVLAPVIAENITVEALPPYETIQKEYKTLSGLKTGEKAEIIGIARACRGAQRRRLMDLGIVAGSSITAELVSMGGDPVAYQIRGALIALRRDQSRHIYIKMNEEKVSVNA